MSEYAAAERDADDDLVVMGHEGTLMPPIPDYPDDMPTGGASFDISPWWLILGIVAFLVFVYYAQKNIEARMAREWAEEEAEQERERAEYGTDEEDEDGDDWEGDTTLTPEQIRHWRNLLAGTGADPAPPTSTARSTTRSSTPIPRSRTGSTSTRTKRGPSGARPMSVVSGTRPTSGHFGLFAAPSTRTTESCDATDRVDSYGLGRASGPTRTAGRGSGVT